MKRKLFAMLLLSATMLMSTTSSALATTISPMYVPSEYVYSHSTTNKFRLASWNHETNNPTSLTQSLQFSVSRTLSTSISVAQQTTINTMVAKAGVSFEVSIGASETRTVSRTWSIPANSRWMLYYGSQIVEVAGYEDYYSNNKLISSKRVSGTWTFSSYDDMTRLSN